MALTFSSKPKGLKYTDLAIYIDANMQYIKNNGEYPEIESRIFEYIYHIVYALSLKAGYFRDFADYDDFSCYAATDIYLAIRKKFLNEGQTFHGKPIVPVKSSLNFIKATLFPLKINYQRDYFRQTTHPKFEEAAENLLEQTKESIRESYRDDLLKSWTDVLSQVSVLLDTILRKTPFRNDPVMLCRLKSSVLLTLLNDLTLPNAVKQKILDKQENWEPEKLINSFYKKYLMNPVAVLRWHLDESFDGYIRLLTIKLKKELSKCFEYMIYGNDFSDELIDGIVNGTFDNSDYNMMSDT